MQTWIACFGLERWRPETLQDMQVAALCGASNKGDFLKKEKDPALKETGWEKEVVTKQQ